ncbi:uncharacterized protein [Anabrus simplex]|uniref:uncharacterized protein n=1 Tax=Anabrus simplex TaxID=316456 RepID=UPI0035A3C108
MVTETLDNGEEEEEEYLHPLSQQDSNEDEIYNSYEGLKKKQEKSENKRVTITKRKLSSMSGTEKKQKREGLMKESISNDGKRKARIKITPRFQNHSTGKIVPKFSKSAKNVPRDKQTIKNKVLQRNEEEDMEDEEIVLSQDIFGDDEINNKEHYSEETEDFTNMATIGTGDILNTESKDTCSNSITSNSNTKRKAQEKKIHKANAADVGLTTENICDQPSQGKSGSKDMNLTPDSNTTVQNNYKDADNVILTLTSQRSTTSQRIAKHNTESTLFGNNRTQNSKNSASNITTGDILNTERKDTCSNSVTSNSNIKRKAQEKKIHKANAADVGLTTENVCDQPSQGKSGSKDMNLTSDSNTTVQNGYKDADNVISTLTSQGSTTSQRIAKNNTESKLFGKNITQNSKNSASNITTLEMQTCNEYDNHKDEKVEPPSTSSRQSTQQNCAIASMSGSSRINSPCPASIFNRTTPRRVPGETQDDNTDAVVPQIELNLNDVENTCEADLSSDDFEAEE